jgi:uncharacterized protein DUF4232
VRSRLAVLVVALAAAAAVTTSAAGSTPTCRAAQLRGHLLNSSGAAGTIVLSVTLTNRGATCTLKGYTRLQLMAGARRPLATRVVHGGLAVLSQRPHTVVLRQGATATVLIAYGDVPTGYERCPTGTEILLRVPADQTWIGVLARTTACNHGTLRESPLLAGRRRAP